MKKQLILLLVVLCLFVTGCNNKLSINTGESSQEVNNDEGSSSQSKASVSDPEKALEEIYKDIEIKGVEDADYTFVAESIGVDIDDFYECFIKKTDGRFGIADIYIIEPADPLSDTVKNALISYKEKRIAESRDYNIYNSLEIAQNAQIITRGKYVIMVMVEDNDAAIEILEEYISAGK